MNLDNILEVLKNWGVAIGGWSVVIIGISTVINKRINIKWQQSADQQLAKHKSKLDTNQDLINNIFNQQSSGFHIGQERRFKAIEILWENLTLIKDFCDMRASLVYNILTEKEIRDFWTRESGGETFETLRNSFRALRQTDLIDKFDPYVKKISIERPFLGEQIFLAYDIYKI